MPGPIFYEGKPLFVNGKIAMHEDCCCAPVLVCACCPEGVAEEYFFSLTNVQNDFCNDCSNLNGTHFLEAREADFPNPCVWEKEITLCGFPDNKIVLSISCNEGIRTWQVEISETDRWVLHEDESESCLEAKTLTLENASFCSYPDDPTITLHPAT